MYTTQISLLERLRQPGEQAAWARFVELYTPLLYHWARRAGLQDSDAADLVQDVFTTLVRKLHEFVYDPNKSFRQWLRTVTLNKWRDRLKRAHKLQQLPEAALSELAEPDDADPFWETEFRQHLIRRALEILQAEFQPATWKAFWEFVVCGRPARQVAAELGISENAVYIAKCRVLRRLREDLVGMTD
jgi:RNA polymerase sigma-70 factor (ECF subfamily)